MIKESHHRFFGNQHGELGVDTMLNPLGKKRIRVDAIPNSLHREINSLRSRYHAFGLTSIKYTDMTMALAYCYLN